MYRVIISFLGDLPRIYPEVLIHKPFVEFWRAGLRYFHTGSSACYDVKH